MCKHTRTELDFMGFYEECIDCGAYRVKNNGEWSEWRTD